MKFLLNKIVPNEIVPFATLPNEFLRYEILSFGFSAFRAIIHLFCVFVCSLIDLASGHCTDIRPVSLKTV